MKRLGGWLELVVIVIIGIFAFKLLSGWGYSVWPNAGTGAVNKFMQSV